MMENTRSSGLAPYGEPKYVQKIYDHLIDVKDDGSFRLNMQYFNYCTGLTMTNSAFSDLFGKPPRESRERLSQREMDLARSVQVVTEEVVLRICRALRQMTGERNLCLAGGVALNCVANGRIHRSGLFEKLWIQPASGGRRRIARSGPCHHSRCSARTAVCERSAGWDVR